MSILINGMEMPTDCCQCKLARYDDYENETFCPFTDVMCLSIGRQDDCPLEEVPSAQPERKKGKWSNMSTSDGEYLCCTQCGYLITVFDNQIDVFPRLKDIENVPYCPNCGADMRGEE